MKVELLRHPTEEDWIGCKFRTIVTVGKTRVINPPDTEWKCKILKAKHSPIRYLQFSFLIEDLPYWVSVHMCRHVHAQPFVKSQRNDRQSDYDRTKAPQDSPVTMVWDMNAEELINICEKRLCMQASEETRQVVQQMRGLVIEKCPEFSWVLGAKCSKYGYCDEMFPCIKGRKLQCNEKENE